MKTTTIAACILAVFFSLFTPLYAANKTREGENFPYATETYDKILTVWHVDTFAGGKGSRADFLTDAAVSFGKTKEGKGAHFLVVTHTVESLEKSVADGLRPDLVSFGLGCGAAGTIVRSIPKNGFNGGEVGDLCFAYPWCAGGYFLIRKKEDNKLISRLYISKGKYDMPALAIGDRDIDISAAKICDGLTAYSEYLRFDDAALVGTQRDINRLDGRGIGYYAEPLTGFSDLVQYIGVCSGDENYELALAFAQYLTSEEVAKKLGSLGMLSTEYIVYDDGALAEYDFSENYLTISPFTEKNALISLAEEATDGDRENERIKNALKRL